MGMTSHYAGSLRYSMNGKRRKTKSMRTRTKRMSDFNWDTPLVEPKAVRETKEYPSAPLGLPKTNVDDSWKVEESKNFTIAPAYNKGAYQVIPRDDVKHIGK